MTPYRTIVVDDEAPARQRLRKLLANFAEIEVVAEAADGEQAVEMIERLRPDLVFLDIQMPELDGFQVVQQLEWQPLVIFVTAYDEYALRAFDTLALDYLLKPVTHERLARTLGRLRDLFEQRETLQQSMQRLAAKMAPPASRRIHVKLGDRTRLIKPEEVLFFQASEKYTTVVTAEKSYLISTSLSELERQLDARQFMRIHRKHIVNIDRIAEILTPHKDKMAVVLDDARRTRLDVGRSYQAKVREV